MIGTKEKRIVAVIIAMLITIAAVFAVANSITVATAETADSSAFSGRSVEIDNKVLYDATNTYNYKSDAPDVTVSNERDEYVYTINNMSVNSYRSYEYYDMSEKNFNVVSNDMPQITVLTHGFYSSASDWSNITVADGSYKFAEDKDSLFSNLAEDSGANVYWAKMDSHNSFRLIDLHNSNNIVNGVYINSGAITITEINDISKHIIIVFEATCEAKEGYNNYVYEEFNYSKKIYFCE